MIDVPLKPICPKCGTKGIDNLITEQPLRYFNKMPGRISLSPKNSMNSAWVNWDRGKIICRNYGYTSSDGNEFEQSPGASARKDNKDENKSERIIKNKRF